MKRNALAERALAGGLPSEGDFFTPARLLMLAQLLLSLSVTLCAGKSERRTLFGRLAQFGGSAVTPGGVFAQPP